MLASEVLRQHIQKIKDAPFYSLMVDETSDITRLEQISVVIRHVSDDLQSSETFLGFYETSDTKSKTLFKIVEDILLRFGLSFGKMRGQCYDGAAYVAGHISGLQTRVREVEKGALFVHCNAHQLNLVVQDGMERVKEMKNFIGTIKDLLNFIRDSPKSIAEFNRLKTELSLESSDKDGGSLSPFCPTRYVADSHEIGYITF